MPWTIGDVDAHVKGLNPTQKQVWVKVANKARSSCLGAGKDEKTCDASAIRQANAVAKHTQTLSEIADAASVDVKFDEEFGWIVTLQENVYEVPGIVLMSNYCSETFFAIVEAFDSLKENWLPVVRFSENGCFTEAGSVAKLEVREGKLVGTLTDLPRSYYDRIKAGAVPVAAKFYEEYSDLEKDKVYLLVLNRVDFSDKEES